MKKRAMNDYLFVETTNPEIELQQGFNFQKISRRCRKSKRRLARMLIQLWPDSNSSQYVE
jgi:hypothetical protein